MSSNAFQPKEIKTYRGIHLANVKKRIRNIWTDSIYLMYLQCIIWSCFAARNFNG